MLPDTAAPTDVPRTFSGLAAARTSSQTLPDVLYLSRRDVEEIGLGFGDVEEVVQRVFLQKGLGKLDAPPKRGIVPWAGSSIRAMMGHLPSFRAGGIKWISAFPHNADAGLPTITGLMILNDVSTGFPKAIMDCTWITAMRTAASTLVAARHMARPGSETVGIVACGLQGRMNLEALCTRFPVRRVKAYDKRPEVTRNFVRSMGELLGFEIEPVASPVDAARDVDILVTSMPIVRRPSPPIDAGVLAPGAFACLLDYNAALTAGALSEVDKVVVDDQAQLRFFRSIGYFRGTPEPDGDLGKVVAGRQRGREADDQRIVALNLGIGVLDVATASLLHERAVARGLGTRLPL